MIKEDPKIFSKPPSDFLSKVDVGACYMNHQNTLLLLKRAKDRIHPETWGVPAGKAEINETIEETITREVLEETGVKISLKDLKKIGILYVRTKTLDYSFHMYYYFLKYLPAILLSKEHTSFKWTLEYELYDLPLIPGALESFEFYQQWKKKYGC